METTNDSPSERNNKQTPIVDKRVINGENKPAQGEVNNETRVFQRQPILSPNVPYRALHIRKGKFAGYFDTRHLRCYQASCRLQSKHCWYCKTLPYVLLRLRKVWDAADDYLDSTSSSSSDSSFGNFHYQRPQMGPDKSDQPKEPVLPPSKAERRVRFVNSMKVKNLDTQLSTLLHDITELIGDQIRKVDPKNDENVPLERSNYRTLSRKLTNKLKLWQVSI